MSYRIKAIENTYGIESIVNHMLQVFAHPNLLHQFVFVSVHASQLSNMSENVLQSICELKCIYIIQSILYMGVNNKLS